MDRRQELQVAAINEDQHTLMGILNAVQCAIAAPRPKDDRCVVADLGLASLRARFALEEELGERTGYPQTAEHQFKHRHLMLTVTSLIHDVLSRSTPPEIQDENIALLRQVFLNHIAEDDQPLSLHLKRHGTG